jgi:hypothetical protein
MAEVEFDDLLRVDAVFASEVTGDDIMSEYLNERNAESGDDDENVTFTEAYNMTRRRRRFVMPKKDISDCLLESIEIL